VRTLLAAAVLLAATGAGTARAMAADPNALWMIVHDHCVPDKMNNKNPAPCAEVKLGDDPDKGFAILKDLEGETQYLLIPTARITGIESPALLAPDAPNYFAEAWAARGFVDAAAHRELPRDDLSLAINSIYARSQNQLHIHIDCTRSDVRDAVRRELAAVGDKWAPFPEPLRGHRYWAMRVLSPTLDGIDPFKLLADGLPGAKAAMAAQTIVIVGADFPEGPGFVILATHADPAARSRGGGEELQDHACAVARS